MVGLWNMTWMKSRVRVAEDRPCCKNKGEHPAQVSLSQAMWVLDPLNSICTFSDSDPFPRPKLLTPGWTNMNLLAGITALNVWNVGCLTNLSWIIILRRVASASPKACSLAHIWDVNKGYTAKSVCQTNLMRCDSKIMWLQNPLFRGATRVKHCSMRHREPKWGFCLDENQRRLFRLINLYFYNSLLFLLTIFNLFLSRLNH